MSKHHQLRFDCIQLIRNFFLARQYRDVLTPPIVENPGMEVHLHPLSVYSEYKKEKAQGYLHTSPEFLMKELLSESFEQIFTINYCFRDEPSSSTHRRQFIMLEWYRTNSKLQDLIVETIDLVEDCCHELEKLGYSIDKKMKNSSFEVKTVQEIFLEYLKLPILDYLEAKTLKDWIKKHRPHLLTNDHEDWPYEDYFFLLFLNEIEPQLVHYPKLILKEYPAPLAALSRIEEDDPRACLRFELYLNGVEIANCFEEECSHDVLYKRFQEQHSQKKKTYGYSIDKADRFLTIMKKGLPASSGIALGVERLAGQICDQAIPFWD